MYQKLEDRPIWNVLYLFNYGYLVKDSRPKLATSCWMLVRPLLVYPLVMWVVAGIAWLFGFKLRKATTTFDTGLEFFCYTTTTFGIPNTPFSLVGAITLALMFIVGIPTAGWGMITSGNAMALVSQYQGELPTILATVWTQSVGFGFLGIFVGTVVGGIGLAVAMIFGAIFSLCRFFEEVFPTLVDSVSESRGWNELKRFDAEVRDTIKGLCVPFKA